jgi:hypothetical protein
MRSITNCGWQFEVPLLEQAEQVPTSIKYRKAWYPHRAFRQPIRFKVVRIEPSHEEVNHLSVERPNLCFHELGFPHGNAGHSVGRFLYDEIPR